MKTLFDRFLVVGNEENNYNTKRPFKAIDTQNGALYLCAFEGDKVIYGNMAKSTAKQVNAVYAMGINGADFETLTATELKTAIDNFKKDGDHLSATIEHFMSSGAKHATEEKVYKDGHKEKRPLTLAEQLAQGLARCILVQVNYYGKRDNVRDLFTSSNLYKCNIISDTTKVVFTKVGYLEDLAK